MEELAYALNDKDGAKTTYTIVEYASADTFDFMPNGGTVRRAKKQDGKWLQVSGDDTNAEIIKQLAELLEQHHQQ